MTEPTTNESTRQRVWDFPLAWAGIIGFSLFYAAWGVSAPTTLDLFAEAAGRLIGVLLLPAILAGVAAGAWRLFGDGLTAEGWMWTYGMAYVLVLLANMIGGQ